MIDLTDITNMTRDYEPNEIKAMSDKELFSIYEAKQQNSSCWRQWYFKQEIKLRKKLVKVKHSCSKVCNLCNYKLLCTLSSANGSVYARDKVDMSLSYQEMLREYDTTTAFMIPVIRAIFKFNILHSEDHDVYCPNVVLCFRLLPATYNNELKQYESISKVNLPTTFLDYDTYSHYYLHYDSLFTSLVKGRLTSPQSLDKMRCPILLEEAFYKIIHSLKNANIEKKSLRLLYFSPPVTPTIQEQDKMNLIQQNKTYHIISLAQLKKSKIYTPIDITPPKISKTKEKEYKELIENNRRGLIPWQE